MAAIDTKLGSALVKFTFSDDDGDILASFRVNPTDPKIVQRLNEVKDYFADQEKNTPEFATIDDVIELNDEIEEKICYILGYDARESLFGQISATTVMSNGTMFVTVIVDKIASCIPEEMNRRQKSMSNAVKKHTAKYAK